ncbi:hypothetical protein Bca52824_061749 [Brassica carinata]|uniref:Acyl-coenzyme A oxidase n=1 Tax=Brassica carinata TaxID=52824 RepID=A0A8X7U6M3_BRACI|nr:hypothetical protein Bca52824_061749 [Brassica carinata]
MLAVHPPEVNESYGFQVKEMRKLLDGHNLEDRDWLYGIIIQSNLFNRKIRGGKVFVGSCTLLEKGVFKGWLTETGPEAELKKFVSTRFVDGNAIKFFGTKRHHEKWLKHTEDYLVKGCFAMTELGHGSNVKGIETVTTYDPRTEEFVINTPCESAQKYWIGEIHVFIAQIRDQDGNICPNIRIADCGHKIGLNGADNGRIWLNLLNSVADVSPDGEYVSAIKNPDQRFEHSWPFDSGRVTIASCAIYSAKPSKTTLPLAKTYAMSFAANDMKMMYVKRTPETNKEIHVVSMGLKALLTWHNMRTLQVCETENRVGHLKRRYDVQTTFEGDNNVLMQQVSKALSMSCKKRNKPFKGLGLEHMNSPLPVLPTNSHLLPSDVATQKNVFCLRERDLLERYTCEVAELQERGESREFFEKAILQAVLDAEAKLPAGSIKVNKVTVSHGRGLVRSMYALICMEEDPSLRYGYHSRDSVGDVRREVSKLCIELRPHALALVTSFGIPDAFWDRLHLTDRSQRLVLNINYVVLEIIPLIISKHIVEAVVLLYY